MSDLEQATKCTKGQQNQGKNMVAGKSVANSARGN